MKIPKLCQKCNREPKIIVGKKYGWQDYFRCLDRTFYPIKGEIPGPNCYYFKAKKE